MATCPTWSWQAGEADKTKNYLPKEKQFLITKQVPCYKRCKDIQYTGEHEAIVDEGGEDGGKIDLVYTQESGFSGWVDTHHGIEKIDSIEVAEEAVEGVEDDDDEICDMEDFEDDDDLVIRKFYF